MKGNKEILRELSDVDTRKGPGIPQGQPRAILKRPHMPKECDHLQAPCFNDRSNKDYILKQKMLKIGQSTDTELGKIYEKNKLQCQ